MIINPYTSLKINGKAYDKAALLAFDAVDNLPWRHSFQQFIKDWLDPTPYVIVKTSGSTGTPKRIQLQKEKMVNSAKMTGEYFGFKKGQKALLCLPCDYIAGKMMVVRALVWELDLQLIEPAGNPLKDVNTPIDFAAMVPMQVLTVLKETPEKMRLVRQLIIGGGKVSSQLLKQLQNISTACYATYGMTETITHIAIQPLNGLHKTEAFQTLPDVQVGQDNRDCLTILAPHVSEEQVVTNDIIQIIDPTSFIWLGRHDNVINTGGVKVFPEQIEKKLEILLTSRFFISAFPDKKLGEQVVLIIESTPWKAAQINDFQIKTNIILSKFEHPKHLFFLKKFLETPTGKVQRSKTKSLLQLS